MQCKLGATPACKINHWQEEIKFLRSLILGCGLVEDFKWMHPCYTYQNKNIVLLHVFNKYCALLFPKGVLLRDERSILVQQTENSQTARQLRFSAIEDIRELETTIREYVLEAIELEKAGIKPQLKTTNDFEIIDELKDKFNELPDFKKAFYTLTPGRQRGYLLYFSQPKKTATRIYRIENHIDKILDGKGLNDLF
ncbi:MAG: DUF1801 domain-containing protein [Bacteroidetes Order II. Incertae sedis bacterium]|nr:DUF1801 domain-containing protein [Bacteroidetes Order II. bacterium]